MNILGEIVENKRLEVEGKRNSHPIELLKQSEFYAKQTISLSQHLLDDSKSGIIAEIKRKSPSKGVLNENVNLEEVSTGYVKSGASAISVLTDHKYFGGSNEDLGTVRKFNDCPILRKDFIIDAYQIHEAKSIGADAILLMASVLTKDEIIEFTKLARSLGLEILLEFHTIEELEKLDDDLDVIVGINSRDLKTLSVDVNHFEVMIDLIPKHFVKIAESGLGSVENVMKAKDLGYNGFLIGTAFMSQPNPAKAIQELTQNLKEN